MEEEGITAGSYKSSLASGDADEVFCEPCVRTNKWVAVEGYCQICQEYLCSNCLEVHKNLKMTQGHTILDRSKMPKTQGSIASSDLCVEVCAIHHPEVVRFYCKAHNETGCVDCMTLNHTSCKIDRVQNISAGFDGTNDFKMMKKSLNKLHAELEVMKDALNDNLKDLDTTYNTIELQITSFREHINDYLDQIQKLIIDETAKLKRKQEAEMKQLIAENESMKSELENILRRTENDTDSNMNSIFVIAKQAENRLVTMERDINKMKQSQQKHHEHQYEFCPSPNIEHLVLSKTPLGELNRKTMNLSIAAPHRLDINTTTTTYSRPIYVKIRTDKDDCNINDCTLLSPHKMVITDRSNKTIKLIDLNNDRVISNYSTSTIPRGVTTVGKDQVAVTLLDEKKIQLLHASTTFAKLYDIHVDNDCFGIAYNDGKFAVSDTYPGRVRIINMQGQVLYTIQPKQGDKDVLQAPYFIAFGQDIDSVIVSDFSTHKVNVITFRGQILRTYTHASLRNPRGIFSTVNGVQFICSSGSNGIHVVSPDFKDSKIIINNENTVKKPRSITYCDINHTLYISTIIQEGGDMNNTIKVYNLNM